MKIETSTVTVEQISKGENSAYQNPGDVLFQIEYPKDYKEAKFIPDGEIVTISKESAEGFIKRGIGKIVKADEVEESDKKDSATEQDKSEVNTIQTTATSLDQGDESGNELKARAESKNQSSKADKKDSATEQKQK